MADQHIGDTVNVQGAECVLVLKEQIVDIYVALEKITKMSQWTVDEFDAMSDKERQFRSEMFLTAEQAGLFASNYITKEDRAKLKAQYPASKLGPQIRDLKDIPFTRVVKDHFLKTDKPK